MDHGASGRRQIHWWSPSVVCTVGVVVAMVVFGVVSLLRDEDRWGAGLILVVALLAALQLVRTLIGHGQSEVTRPTTLRHTAVLVVVLGILFFIKGVSGLKLSVASAAVNAVICLGILLFVGLLGWAHE